MNCSRPRHELGQGLIEFAVILPLFAFLLGAVVDVGAAMGRYNTISNASKEGARLAAVSDNPPDVGAIIQRVKAAAGGPLDGVDTNCGAGAPSICVQWIRGPSLGGSSQAPGELGSSVRVLVKYAYKPMIGMIAQFGDFNIETCAIQRVERPVNPPNSAEAPGVTGCG